MLPPLLPPTVTAATLLKRGFTVRGAEPTDTVGTDPAAAAATNNNNNNKEEEEETEESRILKK